MTAIYLIRHGQALSGQDNYDQLSPLGEQQANHLGESLAQRLPRFEQIIVGGMLRHKQTAERCMQGFGMDLLQSEASFDARWNEYDHQDILRQFRPEFINAAGVNNYIAQQPNPKQAFEADFNSAINRWMSGQHNDDYQESWQQFSTRVHQAFQQVLDNSQGAKQIAVFTSGGPISLIAQSLLGVEQVKLMQMNWTLLNCGVSKCVRTPSRVFLASLNEHTHFEKTEFRSFLTYS